MGSAGKGSSSRSLAPDKAPSSTLKKSSPRPTVFFDFDNTITAWDVIDALLQQFSSNDAWKELETKWARGEISTQECLEGQIQGLRITQAALDRYLSTVPLDGSFQQLLQILDSQQIPVVILSDNFDYLVRKILRSHGIRALDVVANKIRFSNDRLIPSFPYQSPGCLRCAHCKGQTMIQKLAPNSIAVYLGDGLSDVCPAKRAKIVFAKDSLLAYLEGHAFPHIPFQTLGDVVGYFRNDAPWLKSGS